MRLTRLIKALKHSHPIAYTGPDFDVKGISCNSKKVGNGFLFVAINGASKNGGMFINEAIEKGARAVIAEASELSRYADVRVPCIAVKDVRKALAIVSAEFYGNPSGKINVVGITGTNGKTTLSYLIESLLKNSGRNPAVIGTINYRFNAKVLESKNTTPGPVELQSMLAEMARGRVDYCVMEVSSHALHQDRAAGIAFHSALFTNLTQDHLDYHKTIKNYFQSKTRLFSNLSASAFSVINADDAYGSKLKRYAPCKVITYGITHKADVKAEDIRFDSTHTEFLIVTAEREIKIKTKLIGLYNVYNLLAAIAWALEEGIDVPVIQSVAERFHSVPGRLEKINFKGDFSVFVDYAHTEDALRNVIRTLRQVAKKRIIVVFGCGGERDKAKRPKMGRVVSDLADYAVITNDNPRSENPQDILHDITQGIKKNNYRVVADRMEAIKKSLSIAMAGDIVLIAGKGHEHYQILKDKTLRFDDRLAARKCLRGL
jgi:UDP-N-acetylmuramoyl-L-alanyl-D-glutamate--2,6-diaminopimelate ligase